MAGGLGTRLRPLTCNVPKPMVPIINRPILEHTISLLQKHGIADIVLLLFYLPDYIKDHFGDGSKFGVTITYITPDKDYGTAGSIRQAAQWLRDPCLVVSGDAITDLNISQFVKFHHEKDALISIALSQVGNPSPFGIAVTDKDGRVTRFLEKPSAGQIFTDTVNMGIYVMQPETLEFIPVNRKYYFAKDLFPKLLQERQSLYGFISQCYWKDIGSLRSYQQVHWDWLDGRINLNVKETIRQGNWLGRNVQIGKGVKLEGTVVLGDHCSINDGVQLSNSIVGNNCQIGQGSVISNSILWNNVYVERNCKLNQDVLGTGTQIREGACLDRNVFISNNALLGENCHINANVKIWPEKEVDARAVVNCSVV